MSTTVKLTRRGAKRAKAGHPWVFANDIDGSVKGLPPGGTVDVLAPTGGFVARGTANPNALIAVRLLSNNKRADIDAPAFYIAKLRQALDYRQAIYPDRQSLRLVHGEGDGLPGLTVDRFGDTLVVQLDTLGMEARREVLREALTAVFAPTGAVLRSDSRARAQEGLDPEHAVWWGDVPDAVAFTEGSLSLELQPSGPEPELHFYDQADNRLFAAGLCKGRRVLDVYANHGAWGLVALAAGASEVVMVEKKEARCASAAANAARNGLTDRFTVVHDEGKKTLTHLGSIGERFGAVVLDPPPFAKNKGAVTSALRGYTEVHALALTLVQPGGFLFSTNRSRFIDDASFLASLHTAALEIGRTVRIVRKTSAASDHPVRIGIPETGTLTHYALHVVT